VRYFPEKIWKLESGPLCASRHVCVATSLLDIDY
jgi:hypothetical protein